MSMWKLVVSVAVTLLPMGAANAGGETYSIEYGAKAELVLGVIKGEPRLIAKPKLFHDWKKPDNDGKLKVANPKQWEGHYLAFDIEGKPKAGEKGTLRLVKGADKATKWRLSVREICGVICIVIQADAGQCKGWYLCAEEKGEEATDGEKKVMTYKVFLSEKPKKMPRWYVSVISP